jgi:hypothetical protein
MVVHNIFNIIVADPLGPTYKNVYQFNALNRKCQTTFTSTDHPKFMGSQYGTFFMLPFWHLEFQGGS